MFTKDAGRHQPNEQRDVIVQYAWTLDDVEQNPGADGAPWGVYLGMMKRAEFRARSDALDWALRVAETHNVPA